MKGIKESLWKRVENLSKEREKADSNPIIPDQKDQRDNNDKHSHTNSWEDSSHFSSSQIIEDKEREAFYVKQGTFTPWRLEEASFDTPMKRLIFEKEPGLENKVKSKNKNGSPLAWFAFGMLILYATMAFLKYSTLVPK